MNLAYIRRKSKMSVKVVIVKVRLSYANVWKPKVQGEVQKPKYSVSIIIQRKILKQSIK